MQSPREIRKPSRTPDKSPPDEIPAPRAPHGKSAVVLGALMAAAPPNVPLPKTTSIPAGFQCTGCAETDRHSAKCERWEL